MIPGLGRSPGEGKGYPLQYSGLENSMDYSPRGYKESDFSDFHFHSLSQYLYKLISLKRKITFRFTGMGGSLDIHETPARTEASFIVVSVVITTQHCESLVLNDSQRE